jgi:hypothetical protein
LKSLSIFRISSGEFNCANCFGVEVVVESIKVTLGKWWKLDKNSERQPGARNWWPIAIGRWASSITRFWQNRAEMGSGASPGLKAEDVERVDARLKPGSFAVALRCRFGPFWMY